MTETLNSNKNSQVCHELEIQRILNASQISIHPGPQRTGGQSSLQTQLQRKAEERASRLVSLDQARTSPTKILPSHKGLTNPFFKQVPLGEYESQICEIKEIQRVSQTLSLHKVIKARTIKQYIAICKKQIKKRKVKLQRRQREGGLNEDLMDVQASHEVSLHTIGDPFFKERNLDSRTELVMNDMTRKMSSECLQPASETLGISHEKKITPLKPIEIASGEKLKHQAEEYFKRRIEHLEVLRDQVEKVQQMRSEK